MRRIAFILAMVLVTVACAAQVDVETRYDSPVATAWDAPDSGFADYYQIAIQQDGTGDIEIIADAVMDLTYTVDLETLGLYGEYVALCRSVTVTAGLYDYSDWIRSDDGENADAVLWVDGVAQTWSVYRIRPAGLPRFFRVE